MSFWNTKKTYIGDIPPRSTTAIYCGASVFRDACYQLVSAWLLTYISFSGLLSHDSKIFAQQMLFITIFIFLCRIWDGVNDPIMGWILEKVHFKWGKYKPWIFIGAVLNTGVVLTLFLAHPTGWGFVALFAVFYFLWDFAWTINDIAYWAMLPSLTKDEKRRNNITSIMQICISIGVFAVYGAVPMLVGAFEGVSAQTIYGLIAIVICSLYLISQMLIAFGCQEHQRDASEEQKEQDNVKAKDIFTLLKKNDQFRVNIIAFLLEYLGEGIVVGFGSYYFYLMFGYGSDAGGSIQFLFTVMYAVGTLIAQVAYPFLSRILTRKKIMAISFSCLAIGYVALFLIGFPVFGNRLIADWGMEWLLYICAVILFFGQGLYAILIIVQLQATVEYNEWKFGERKEALISSMRALVAKWASAIQALLIYGTLMACNLYDSTTAISNAEYKLNAGVITDLEFSNLINSATTSIESWQFNVMSIGMVGVPLVLLAISIYLSSFVYKIDEKKYAEICKDLDARRAQIN